MYFTLGKVILAGLVSTLLAQNPIENHQLRETGILFEDIGRAVTYQQRWTIMTQMNIPNWSETLTFVNTCEKVLETLCKSLNHTIGQDNCEHWEKEIKTRTINLHEKVDEIQIYSQCKHTREKRGLVNAGGVLSKFLFGTMDHEDSEHIYNKLDELESSNKQSINLAKQQITLMKTNNDILGKSLLNITAKQNVLIEKTNKFFTSTINTLNNVTIDIKYLHVITEINEITLFMLYELQKISEQITSALFVLESLQRHDLNPLMISASDLTELYRQISTTQNKNLNSNFNLVKLLAKTYSKCMQGKIIMKIIIPVFEELIFTVNHVHLLPIPMGDGTFSVLASVPNYLFNSSFAHRNFELDELQFRSDCTTVNTTFFICKIKGPIRSTPGEGNCIRNLFKNPFVDPPTCEHRILKQVSNFVIPLKHENSWLYWLHAPIPLYSQCPDELTTTRLQGLGIFRLLKSCTFRLDEFIIPFKSDMLHNISYHQPSEIKFPNLERYKPYLNTSATRNNYKNISILDTTNLHTYLAENSRSVQHLDSEIEQLEQRRSTEILHFKFNALSIVLSSLLLLIGIYSVRKCILHLRRPPSSTPQTHRPQIHISHPIEIPRREQFVISMPNLTTPRPPVNDSHYLEPRPTE